LGKQGPLPGGRGRAVKNALLVRERCGGAVVGNRRRDKQRQEYAYPSQSEKNRKGMHALQDPTVKERSL